MTSVISDSIIKSPVMTTHVVMQHHSSVTIYTNCDINVKSLRQPSHCVNLQKAICKTFL